MGCLALAFWGTRFNVEETAPTILLAMDVSDSMEQTDVAPNRLAAAKAAVAFLDELPPSSGRRQRLRGRGRLAVEPTQDRERVIEALGNLTTERGTVIGDGLTEALDAIEAAREGQETPAAALLLSDGRDTGSRVPPPTRRRAPATSRSRLHLRRWSGVRRRRAGRRPGSDAVDRRDEQGRHVHRGDVRRADQGSTRTSGRSSRSISSSITSPFVVAAIALTILSGLLFIFLPR